MVRHGGGLLERPAILEQVAEAAHRGLVGHRLAAEVDPNEAAHRQRIVKRLLHRPGVSATHPTHLGPRLHGMARRAEQIELNRSFCAEMYAQTSGRLASMA